MKSPEGSLIACPHCDCLHRRGLLDHGQAAYCVRCGARLYVGSENHVDGTLALSLSALIFFLLVISFPFLGISVNGIERQTSLLGGVVQLYQGETWILAVLVGLVLILFPMLKILGLVALLLPLRLRWRVPRRAWMVRLVEWVSPWNMTEIYLIAVIVTFVKLAAMATIIYGVAFWAFIAFVVTMTAATSILDFTTLWEEIEHA